MTAEDSELPKGWVWVSAAAVVVDSAPIIYGILQPGPDTEGGIPYVRPTEIVDDTITLASLRRTTTAIAQRYSRSRLKTNDIVMSMVGTIGKVAVVPPELDGGNITQSSVRFRADSRLLRHEYLSMALRSTALREQYQDAMLGTAVPRLNVEDVRSLRLPLAPLPEQHRIVAKIEELFSDLDAGADALKKTQVLLKRYRQSVLKAAFEGKLTEEWRKRNKGKLEPASLLLERIQAERKKTAGKKFKELPPVDTTELPELPEGWVWTTIERCGFVGTGATPKKSRVDYYDGGRIPWVTSSVVNQPFVSEVSSYITEKALTETNCKIFPKHTLLVAMYGEGKTRGKVTELLIEATTNQACAAIVLEGETTEIRPFLKAFLLKNYDDTRRLSSGGVQPNLNLDLVKNLSFPVPPLQEQKQIVAEIERRFTVADQVEKTVEQSLKQSQRLRQSILKRTFSGRLVPQDPRDEPAEKLLERIRQQRLSQTTATPRRPTSRNRKQEKS